MLAAPERPTLTLWIGREELRGKSCVALHSGSGYSGMKTALVQDFFGRTLPWGANSLNKLREGSANQDDSLRSLQDDD